ncbi:MAG: hypothetical protein ACODAJ_09670, partial [Planctomycetota bacterium]
MSWRAVLCALVAVALAAPQARAGLIAADDFDAYTPGTPLDGAGGTSGGWTSPWAADPADVSVQSGVIPDFARSVQIDTTGNNANIAHRGFAPQAGTVYAGLLLRTTGGWSSDDFLQFYLDESSTGDPNNLGVSGGVKNESASPYFARIDGSGNTDLSTTAFHDDGQTQQVVLKFSKTGGGDYDRTDIFVNRPDESTADASRTTGSSGVSSLSEFHVRTYGIDPSDLILLDELRIATTYGEALAITPE